MRVTSFTKESEQTEEMFVTTIEHNTVDYTLASYVYNGELAEDETNPSYWNAYIFYELKKDEQIRIRQLVNKNILKNYP